MKSLFKLIKQNRICVSFSFVFTFLSIGAQLVWTLYIGRMADSIVERSGIPFAFIIAMFALLIGNGLLQYLDQIVNRYTSEKMAHTLRMNFADAILSMNDSEEATAGYEAVSKVQNELMTASEYMSNTLFDIVGMTLSGVFALLFLIFQNALLTAIVLSMMIIVVVIVNRLGKKLVPLTNEALDKKVIHNKTVYSVITNFDSVLVFDAKSFFAHKYEKELNDWAQTETKRDRISAVCNSLSGVLSQMPLLILFAAGAIMVWKGFMTIGTIIVFLNMLKSLLRTLMNLPSWMVSVKDFLVHLSRADMENVTGLQ